ncbi:MAG: PAS domain S-box protein [Spirulina sp. SIO3F2]|nr:PAS domain S-box protein [Spirulina sp. SIO3F2]
MSQNSAEQTEIAPLNIVWVTGDRAHTALTGQLKAAINLMIMPTIELAHQISQTTLIDGVILAVPDTQILATLQPGWLRTVPCMVCLEHQDESLGLRCIQAGVQDYLLPQEITIGRLQRMVHSAKARFQQHSPSQLLTKQLPPSLPTVVFQSDADDRLTFVSPAWEQLTGLATTETVGTQLSTYIYPSDRSAFTKICHQLRHATAPRSQLQKCLVRLFDPTAQCRWCEVCLLSQYDDQGQYLGFQGQLYDITSHYFRQQDLERSEQIWRSYFDNSLVGLSIISAENTYVQVNQAFCDVLGYTASELMYRCWFDLTHPDDLETEVLLYKQFCCREIHTYTLDKRYIRKDGRPVYVRQAVSGVWNETQELEQIICTLLDLSDKYAAEVALSQSQERLQLALEGSGLGWWDWNLTLNEIYLSAEWNAILGYAHEAVSGSWHLWERLIHPEELELVWQRLQQHFEGKSPFFEVEYRLLTQNGNWKWILARGTVLARDHQNNPLRMTGIHEDISDRKDISQMKDEFVSVVSHELRTPLTSIHGALKLLKTGRLGCLSERGEDMLGIAVRNTERLTQLINDILDLERLERGHLQTTKQWCNTHDLVQQAIETLQTTAQELEVIIEVIHAANLGQYHGHHIWADPLQIVQVLTNLLSNAIKFSPPQSNVMVMVRANTEAVLFEVQDHGRGIPNEKLETIFERFQQVDASDTRQRGGTGLGLTISRQIVEQHGGQIWAESSLGYGSLFAFTIPHSQTSEVAAAQLSSSNL